jgi:hypothetical protein
MDAHATAGWEAGATSRQRYSGLALVALALVAVATLGEMW